MVENSADTRPVREFQTLFGATANILQLPKKQYPYLHYPKSIRSTNPGWLHCFLVASHTSRVTVRYSETDQMGVVYHANYLVWMEVARTELCKAAGFAYSEMEADGVLLAVAEASCRYLRAAKYGEDIDVVAQIADSNRRFIEFHYTMMCGERKVATGKTRHIFLNKEFKPTRLPDRYAVMLSADLIGPDL